MKTLEDVYEAIMALKHSIERASEALEIRIAEDRARYNMVDEQIDEGDEGDA